ncbi:FAD-dependent oxidoreductase [Streptomyces luteolus]|uniref:FAD-dependent oxidoreductase n=1 Tax=Streptomyces luteolus TaxID=3043615 RepID=A0ABT6T510_9ACTN|nr:FAD-dependent oxidoreductase [Streptomyces sp. B-S-A12]MDI3422953.1 FAD-dependent oxidoreductase [Streptomyces sp. B-S-A12]
MNTAEATPQTAPSATRHSSSEGADAIPTVTPEDARYPDMIRGHGNNRHVASPEAIRLPSTTEHVVQIVREAVRDGKRIALRSGGHCFENLVFNDESEIIVDMRMMDKVGFDADRGAFLVEPGATLLKIYEQLHMGWGVTLPGGGCYATGAGGHFSGGGYGILSRRHGVLSDHLYAVEVVTVDERGEVRVVVATRDPEDPDHDLAWAVAGGGGGNFGVVTRFWMRSRDAEGAPGDLLPKAPATVFSTFAAWSWDEISEEAFANFMSAYADWSKAHGGLDSPYLDLGHWIFLQHAEKGTFNVVAQMDSTVPNARQLVEDFIAFAIDALGVQPRMNSISEKPFLKATAQTMTAGETITSPSLRTSHKSTYMKEAFPAHQIETIYHYLTKTENPNPYSFMVINSVRGMISALPDDATAATHRDALWLVYFESYWHNEEDDRRNVEWLRAFYRELYADTGGVPVPNGVTDGCYINYPDNDLSDPSFNTSGLSSQELYYKDNYPRLQRVKKAYDPTDFFRHPQSIELPE